MNTLEIRAGEATEDLLQLILQQVDDDTLDQIEIEREQAPAEGLVSEPITIGVVLTLVATGAATGVGQQVGSRLASLIWDRIAIWVQQTGKTVDVKSGDHKTTITPQTINTVVLQKLVEDSDGQ